MYPRSITWDILAQLPIRSSVVFRATPIITRPDASYDWQEHFTAIKGNHTIKVGGQYQDAYTKSRRDRARTEMSFYYYGNYYYMPDYGVHREYGSEKTNGLLP